MKEIPEILFGSTAMFKWSFGIPILGPRPASTPQLPFRGPQMSSYRDYEALNGGPLRDAGESSNTGTSDLLGVLSQHRFSRPRAAEVEVQDPRMVPDLGLHPYQDHVEAYLRSTRYTREILGKTVPHIYIYTYVCMYVCIYIYISHRWELLRPLQYTACDAHFLGWRQYCG